MYIKKKDEPEIVNLTLAKKISVEEAPVDTETGEHLMFYAIFADMIDGTPEIIWASQDRSKAEARLREILDSISNGDKTFILYD